MLQWLVPASAPGIDMSVINGLRDVNIEKNRLVHAIQSWMMCFESGAVINRCLLPERVSTGTSTLTTQRRWRPTGAIGCMSLPSPSLLLRTGRPADSDAGACTVGLYTCIGLRRSPTRQQFTCSGRAATPTVATKWSRLEQPSDHKRGSKTSLVGQPHVIKSPSRKPSVLIDNRRRMRYDSVNDSSINYM